MPRWKHTIRLDDMWDHDLDGWDPEVAAAVAAAFAERSTAWATTNPDVADLADQLVDAADTDNPAWFDDAWARIYDEANADRVWIALNPVA